MLNNKEAEEFKKIAKETMGIDLTDSEAQDQGSRLVTLFELLIKIDRRDKRKQGKKAE